MPEPEASRHSARDAIARGHEALQVGDRASALLWFERAQRLAPRDPVSLFLCASALAPTDPQRALLFLDRLLDAVPMHRDAHVSRIALLHSQGLGDQAADALHALLTGFAAPQTPGFASLADRIAAAHGRAGWAGVTGNGMVLLHTRSFRARLDRRRPFCIASQPCRHQLPPAWHDARLLHVESSLGQVLGTGTDLARIGRVEGVVSFQPPRTLVGWALSRADPDTIHAIDIHIDGARTPSARILADDGSLVMEDGDGAQQARGFRAEIPAHAAAVRIDVRVRNGPPLTGSPILIGLEAQAARDAARSGADPWRPLPAGLAGFLPPPDRAIPARRDIDIIIRLNSGAGQAEACLRSLHAACPPGTRLFAIDDGTAGPGLLDWAQRAHASGALVLLRHDRDHGRKATTDTGLDHTGTRDVILLDSDTLLPPGAIARLADAAYCAADTGTATPMTNDGGITTTGTPGTAAPMPGEAQLAAIDSRLLQASPGLRIDLLSCAVFCVFIRHDCLAETGRFSTDSFAQGYGEEIDFSRRAALLGWRHVAACDVAVAHASPFAACNLDTIERLHPGYENLAGTFTSGDPLRPARRAHDALLWAENQRPSSIILVTHGSGGGVERYIAARAETIRAAGQRAIVIRPRGGFALSDGTGSDTPNLIFEAVPELAAFLRADNPACVELHHIAAHDPSITRLAGLLRIPFDIHVHDYAAICPRVTLTRPDGFYCGEPPRSRDCDHCIADHGARINFSGTVAAARDFTNGLFRAARRVVVGTNDTAARLLRYMPRIQPVVQLWEVVPEQTTPVRRPHRAPGKSATHIAVVGGIGPEKGYPVLLACARDAERRDLPLRFTVIGHTTGDTRLFDTGRVFVTGPFREGEARDLLREAAPDIGFLPSLWPETWCYALSALIEAGLPVIAFALGAQAERLRNDPAALLLPPDTQAAQINDHFLAMARRTTPISRPPSRRRCLPPAVPISTWPASGRDASRTPISPSATRNGAPAERAAAHSAGRIGLAP